MKIHSYLILSLCTALCLSLEPKLENILNPEVETQQGAPCPPSAGRNGGSLESSPPEAVQLGDIFEGVIAPQWLPDQFQF